MLQVCGIKQLSPQIIDLKHLQLPARNTDTHNSQGSTARLTWREKCFHHLAVSQEHLDCPGHTAGCGRLLTHEVPSLMSSSSSYSTTSCSIISIFRSVKNCVFFSSSTKAWLVLTRPVLPETAFYIPDVLSTPHPAEAASCSRSTSTNLWGKPESSSQNTCPLYWDFTAFWTVIYKHNLLFQPSSKASQQSEKNSVSQIRFAWLTNLLLIKPVFQALGACEESHDNIVS